MTARKAPEDKLKVGRPTDYSVELGKKIAEEIATTKDGLEKICNNNPDFPSHKTVYRWRWLFPEFRDIYALARAAQAEMTIEQIRDIAFDDSQDRIPSEKGCWVPDTARIQRHRLQIDTLKWEACKLAPRIYGDKSTTETSITLHENNLQELK